MKSKEDSPPQNPKILTLIELANALNKSESSIRFHIRKKRIKPTVKFGRSYGFVLDDVIKQLQKGIN